MVARTLTLLLIAVGALPFAATTAAADDGPSRLLSATGPVRPPETIDRLVAAGRGALVLIVGGYASKVDEHRAFYAALIARFHDYRVSFFGERDEKYDTYGSVMDNAKALNDSVRRAVRRDDLSEVHLVGHSMGAFTIDHAFALGLRSRDNVASYSALAGAHNGAEAAVRATRVRDAIGNGPVAQLAMAIVGADASDQAAHDLASLQLATAPRDVRTLNVRAINDAVLTGRDSHLAGSLEVTLWVHSLEAHGGIAHAGAALDLVEANVRGKPIRVSGPRELAASRVVAGLDVPHRGLFDAGAAAAVAADRAMRTAEEVLRR